jgi:hypothetical protein
MLLYQRKAIEVDSTVLSRHFERNKNSLFIVVAKVTEVTDSLAMTHTITLIITAAVLNTLAETETVRVKKHCQ